VIRPVPDAAARILRKGVLCYLASAHPSGPHVTPVVFALHGSTLWVTTSRRSVKGRTWRRDDRVGGLVPAGDRTVSFAGRVVTYDLLDPGTWPRSVLHAPTLTRAAAAFSAKNARFFAGYAVDAYRVPLAWTPPGRVFAEIRFDRLAVLDRRAIRRTWGRFGGRVESAHSFRMAAGRRHPLAGVPDDVRERIGTSGDAVLAILGEPAPAVIPCRWTIERDVAYAVAPADMLSLAGGGPDVAASLTVDQASQWRARAMAGVLLQGSGRVHLVSGLRSGARSATAIAEGAGMSPSGAFAVVRLVPHRLVWWRGWDSGTVRPA
jgi:nitroimidazol reductase NimA-like FMN-containing flavoprotein (pyridoxamine 5'-phosphate oxidase superfamily)